MTSSAQAEEPRQTGRRRASQSVGTVRKFGIGTFAFLQNEQFREQTCRSAVRSFSGGPAAKGGTSARFFAYPPAAKARRRPERPPRMIDDLWYKNGVFYCLSVGTYMDANGDGIGDFKGLLRRLDYLNGLGITTIWLMPFQPSPGKDDGYDVSDYYGVDPKYGTIGDFVEFTHGCRQRGIRVIIDLVVNHTSDQHPWFREARTSKDSPYRDWDVWADKKPANADKGMVFPGVQKSTWTP